MEAILGQVFNILTTPPGNLAYYVILAFTVVGALQSSLNHYLRSGFPQGNRMVAGLSLLLLFQLTQFAIAGLIWQGLLDPHTWLPPLDRLVVLLSLICIVWLWLVPEPARLADIALALVFVLAGSFFTLSLLWWDAQPADLTFNAGWPDWGASLFGMGILALGALGLLIRRPNSWGIGLAMLFLLFAGQLYQYALPQMDSNYAAPVRLSLLMAYPWLLALPQRFAVPALTSTAAVSPTVAVRRRYNTDIGLIQDFIALLGTQPSGQDCPRIARSLSQMMLADYCLLVSPPNEDGAMTVACGFNLIEEKELEGFSLDGQLAPMIASAFKRGKSLRLPASSTSTDLQTLAKGLHVPRVGHLLAAPIMLPDQLPNLGIILLSPFSNRGWSREDQDVLVRFANFLAERLNKPAGSAAGVEADRGLDLTASELQENLYKLQQELQTNQELLEKERMRAQSLAEVVSAQQAEGSALQAIEAGVIGQDQDLTGEGYPAQEDAEGQGQVSAQAYEEVQANLRLALEQIAELRADLAETGLPEPVPAQTASGEPILSFEQALTEVPELLELPELDLQPVAPLQNPQEISAVIKDLRQPLAAILGYTDILLGESIGILGKLQRKFLERIRASVERLGVLADDLVQLTDLDVSLVRLNPATVVIDRLVDEAVSETQDQLSQKNILLELEIPENLPDLQADQEALHQVLVSLLRNAADCSPEKGIIRVKASLEAKEHEPGYILLQVADSSEGIPPQDLPRIFSRFLKSQPAQPDEPCSSTIDLASVKDLVEAHRGRIWVDSTIGKGSTFSMLLPLDADLDSE